MASPSVTLPSAPAARRRRSHRSSSSGRRTAPKASETLQKRVLWFIGVLVGALLTALGCIAYAMSAA